MPTLNKFYIVFTAEKLGVFGGTHVFRETIVLPRVGPITEKALTETIPNAIKEREGYTKVMIENVIPLPIEGAE